MEDDDGVAQLTEFEKIFKKLEKRLGKLLELNDKAVEEDLPPLQRAQLNVALAKSINVLYVMLLKVQGVKTKGHPSLNELERIEKYQQKLNALVHK